jgi:Bacterial pre-peptidase C-terminal domain
MQFRTGWTARLLTLAALAAALAACLSACGGRGGSSTGSGASSGSPIPVQTLSDALALIRGEEEKSAGLSRGSSALPVTLNGDDAWVAGPEGGYSVDGGNHTITLSSSGISVDDPHYISFAIFRMSGHTGDAVKRLDLNVDFTSGNYWIYAVSYAAVPVWKSFGPFNTTPGLPDWPLDLSTINPVSPTGNVYVAVVPFSNTTMTIGDISIADEYVPPEYYETEPNDGPEFANPLPTFDFNLDDVTGSLGGLDQHDWFSFNVAAAGRAYMTLDHEYAVGNLEMDIVDSDGITVLASSTGRYDVERIDIDFAAPGNYYVHVYSEGNGGGDYQIWGTYLDTGEDMWFDSEPNNSAEQAQTFPALPFPNPVVLGKVEGGESWDYYKFSVVDMKLMVLRLLRDDDGTEQPLIELLAGDGKTIIGSDSEGGDLFQILLILQAGDFYIRVGTSGGDYEYELDLRTYDYDPFPYYEVEPNNAPITANVLPPFDFLSINVDGNAGQEGIYDGTIADWFSFNVPAEGTVRLYLYRSDGPGEPVLELYDTSGLNPLADSSTGFLPEAISYYFPTAGGPYFLKVLSSISYFDYGLTGTFSPGIGVYTEVEDNDDFTTANTLPAFPFSGIAVTGNLGVEGDNDGDEDDWWSFTVNTSGTVNLDMFIDTVGADLDIFLIGTDGSTLLEQSDTTSPSEHIEWLLTAAGTYYIHAHVYEASDDESAYRLEGSFAP